MVPITELPTDEDAQQAVVDARRLFRRTLANWACDMLALRRSGARHPVWTETPHGSDLRRAA